MNKILVFTFLVFNLCNGSAAKGQCVTNFTADSVSTYSGGYINISWNMSDPAAYSQIYVGGCNLVSLAPGVNRYSIATNSYPCFVGWITLGGVTYSTTTVQIVSWNVSTSCSSPVYTNVPVPSNYLYYSCKAPVLKGTAYAPDSLFVGWNPDFATSHRITYSVNGSGSATKIAAATGDYIPCLPGDSITYIATSVCSDGSTLSTPLQSYTVSGTTAGYRSTTTKGKKK